MTTLETRIRPAFDDVLDHLSAPAVAWEQLRTRMQPPPHHRRLLRLVVSAAALVLLGASVPFGLEAVRVRVEAPAILPAPREEFDSADLLPLQFAH